MKIVTRNSSISVSNQTRVHPKVAIELLGNTDSPLARHRRVGQALRH